MDKDLKKIIDFRKEAIAEEKCGKHYLRPYAEKEALDIERNVEEAAKRQAEGMWDSLEIVINRKVEKRVRHLRPLRGSFTGQMPYLQGDFKFRDQLKEAFQENMSTNLDKCVDNLCSNLQKNCKECNGSGWLGGPDPEPCGYCEFYNGIPYLDNETEEQMRFNIIDIVEIYSASHARAETDKDGDCFCEARKHGAYIRCEQGKIVEKSHYCNDKKEGLSFAWDNNTTTKSYYSGGKLTKSIKYSRIEETVGAIRKYTLDKEGGSVLSEECIFYKDKSIVYRVFEQGKQKTFIQKEYSECNTLDKHGVVENGKFIECFYKSPPNRKSELIAKVTGRRDEARDSKSETKKHLEDQLFFLREIKKNGGSLKSSTGFILENETKSVIKRVICLEKRINFLDKIITGIKEKHLA